MKVQRVKASEIDTGRRKMVCLEMEGIGGFRNSDDCSRGFIGFLIMLEV